MLPGETQDKQGWLVLCGSFALIWAVLSVHCPRSLTSLSSGRFTIYAVRALSPWQLSSVRKAIARGEHAFHENVRVFQCSEYELRALSPAVQSLLVDGDAVQFSAVTAKVLSDVMRTVNLSPSK